MKNITVKDIITACGGELLCGDEAAFLTGIKVDSRKIEAGDLYVPIIGENVDGHKFIAASFASGALATLTSKYLAEIDLGDSAGACIYVSDTATALKQIGMYLRSQMTMPFIGITGSVGKTTTREMVACALSAGLNVTATEGNSNSQIGVPLTLARLNPDADIAVMEMGMSMPGEMSALSKLALVNTAIVTNIGVSHIEFHGTRENIMKEKLHITDAFDKDGVLIVNADDDLLSTLTGTMPCRVITYGLSEGADYRADNIYIEDGLTCCEVTTPSGKCNLKLQVPGMHIVRNALAAIAAAELFGVSAQEAAKALENFTSFSRRLEIKSFSGLTIIDDSYNASPDSMKAAIDVLDTYPTEGRRIAVLADMKELGPDSVRFHKEVGVFAADKKIDLMFTVGELAADILNSCGCQGTSYEDNEQLTQMLLSELRAGDLILFKGSNSMKLNEVIAKLQENYL